nr:ribonuclease H-like domain-containing protein [Tanacetum cinerariifolium]
GNPQQDLQDKGVIDSGCSSHMIGNVSYLIDYKEIDGGYVAFGGNPKRGKITGIENLVDHKVKVIRCDNGTEFKNRKMNQFYEMKACDDVAKDRMETVPGKNYILLPLWTADPLISQESKSSQDDGFQPSSDDRNKVDEDLRQESKCKDQDKENNDNSTNYVNAAGTNRVNAVSENSNNEHLFDPEMPELEDISTFTFLNDNKDDGAEADMNNLDTTI